MNEEIRRLNQMAERCARELLTLQEEVGRIVVGQQYAIERLLIALVSGGHVLLEGVPGLAKTLMVKTIAQCVDSGFVRIQFTPDLLPADIIGTKIYDHKNSSFKTLKGPIFTNFVLADEINRAPPKVQSALLEAMQEEQVSIQGDTYTLKKPFFVLATQNPIESEGTYKLPEAQVDRFMFKLLIGYPNKDEELKIINRFTEGDLISVSKVISGNRILKMQSLNEQIYADQKIKEYVAGIVDATRYPKKYNVDVDGYIEYGASPRASLWLVLGGKTHAMLNARGYVKPEDIKAIAHDVLRHRILLTYEAEAEGVSPDYVIDKILDTIKVP